MESVNNVVGSQIATQTALGGALPKTGGAPGANAGQTGQAGEIKNLFKRYLIFESVII